MASPNASSDDRLSWKNLMESTPLSARTTVYNNYSLPKPKKKKDPAASDIKSKNKSKTMQKSPQKSSEKLTERDLVAFDHAAAGHEGISSNNDGSLVIKPCTQAEIDFYQAAQVGHEGFKAHMPAFMGVLALSPDQTAPANGVSPAVQVHHEVPSELAVHVPQGWLPSNLAPSSLPSPLSSKRTSWKPSGGKKLDTPTAIVLENIASGFSRPNILDVKLGSRLWADDAPGAKRLKLDDVARETTSGSLGFRIAGMKKWVGRVSDGGPLAVAEKGIEYKDGFLCYNKQYGRTFAAHNIKEGFIEFFGGLVDFKNGLTTFKRRKVREVVRNILRELESIRFVLREEETRMYSASVLIIFEGDEWAMDAAVQGDKDRSTRARIARKVEEGTATEEDIEWLPDSDDEDAELPKLYDIRLIDFAHAQFTPGEGPDLNVLDGIHSLIRIFRDLEELA